MAVIPPLESPGLYEICMSLHGDKMGGERLERITEPSRVAFGLVFASTQAMYAVRLSKPGRSRHCPSPKESFACLSGEYGYIRTSPLLLAGSPLRLTRIALAFMCASEKDPADSSLLSAEVEINEGRAIPLPNAAAANGPQGEFILRMESDFLEDIGLDEWDRYRLVFSLSSSRGTRLLLNWNPVCEITAAEQPA